VSTDRPPVSLWLRLAGIAASALLLGLYARGGHAWMLGFVALVPWLLALDVERRLRGALCSAWLMSIAFSAAAMHWFGAAIGAYVGIGAGSGIALLLALAPLLQAQFLAFALVRHLVGLRHGPLLRALAGAAAWVGCEWLFPKLLGDSLGHGLQPSLLLRQAADLGGVAGLSFLLVLCAEALAFAVAQRRAGLRGVLAPLALAAGVVAGLGGYGLLRLDALAQSLSEPAVAVRVGLIQANLTDYERGRQEVGAYAVVREALDTHYALSRAAVEHHGAEALLWSETVYPTSFGRPRSEDGAELDREIQAFVDDLGVPLAFGTYDRDEAGEYNSAAFLEPGHGLIGHYRKTHPFPFTETVPAWLDGPLLRRWLPWTGGWKAGDGARVFPLRTGDGREVSVLPLICLDDVRSALAIDGARLGAQAILGLSNDSWFTGYPLGARLHLAVASFRSIETRLPQLRVTTNGLSAVVDETGEVLVTTAMGDQAVLAAEIPARDPPATLMLRWGDWVGRAGLAFLLGLVAFSLWQRLAPRFVSGARGAGATPPDAGHGVTIVALAPAWRIALALLRLCAAAGLLWLALDMLLRQGLQVNSAAQIRIFLIAVALPCLAAWVIRGSFAGTARIEAGHLLIDLQRQRLEIPLQQIVALEPWRLPLPGSGVQLRLASGRSLQPGIVLDDPLALQRALAAAGSPAIVQQGPRQRLAELAALRAAAPRRWFDAGWFKFGLFPLLPALPAFRLHQVIAFGGAFGEYYTYGLKAWLTGLGIWWAAWAIGLMLFAAALRIGIECASVLVAMLQPPRAAQARFGLEWLGLLLYFAGVPAWLLLRVLAG
jgi:apolipoprotein N-acyltransferase